MKTGPTLFASVRRSLMAALALVLMACSQPDGTVYQVPISQARKILVATGLPPEVFGTEPPSFEVQSDKSQVVWIVRQDGAEIFRYAAHLKEEGPAAIRVDVQLTAATSGPGGNIAKRLDEHPGIKNMFLVAIHERIASALENRPFELTRIYPASAVAVLENVGALWSSADQAAAASERMERENIQKAYRDEAAGR